MEDIIKYPWTDNLSDLEVRIDLGGPRWIRTEVGEVALKSGKTAVFSVILAHGSYPPRTESIQIEGYKTGFFGRKVKRFDEDERGEVTAEVTEKLRERYDLGRFERIYCM